MALGRFLKLSVPASSSVNWEKCFPRACCGEKSSDHEARLEAGLLGQHSINGVRLSPGCEHTVGRNGVQPPVPTKALVPVPTTNTDGMKTEGTDAVPQSKASAAKAQGRPQASLQTGCHRTPFGRLGRKPSEKPQGPAASSLLAKQSCNAFLRRTCHRAHALNVLCHSLGAGLASATASSD